MMIQFVKFLNVPQRYTLGLLSPAIYYFANIRKFRGDYYTSISTEKNLENTDIAIYGGLTINKAQNIFLNRTFENTYFKITRLEIINIPLPLETLIFILSLFIMELSESCDEIFFHRTKNLMFFK